jgi:enamine deaminase RidA (YjgF/YER057c/UK114 family)
LTPEARLRELDIELPAPSRSLASYVPTVQCGGLVYLSGQIPMLGGALLYTGKVGDGVSDVDGKAAARQCAINAIAALKAEVGELSSVKRIVKLTVFIASDPSFTGQSQVANGASDLFLEVFGDLGRHARSAVGVACLPLGSPVEVELVAEVA